jgi:hypothetical protein
MRGGNSRASTHQSKPVNEQSGDGVTTFDRFENGERSSQPAFLAA